MERSGRVGPVVDRELTDGDLILWRKWWAGLGLAVCVSVSVCCEHSTLGIHSVGKRKAVFLTIVNHLYIYHQTLGNLKLKTIIIRARK